MAAAVPILDPESLKQELGREEPAPVYLLAGADGWRAERTAQWLRVSQCRISCGESAPADSMIGTMSLPSMSVSRRGTRQ